MQTQGLNTLAASQTELSATTFLTLLTLQTCRPLPLFTSSAFMYTTVVWTTTQHGSCSLAFTWRQRYADACLALSVPIHDASNFQLAAKDGRGWVTLSHSACSCFTHNLWAVTKNASAWRQRMGDADLTGIVLTIIHPLVCTALYSAVPHTGTQNGHACDALLLCCVCPFSCAPGCVATETTCHTDCQKHMHVTLTARSTCLAPSWTAQGSSTT